MKIKSSRILSLCFFIVIAVNNIRAQTVEETYLYAEDQYETGNYQNASDAFQRVLFFGDDSLRKISYFKLARCYAARDHYDRAYEYFHLAYRMDGKDSLKTELLFMKSSALLHSGQPHLALAELLDYRYPNSQYFEMKKDFYLGFTYFTTGNYKLSRNHLNSFVEELCPQSTAELAKLFEQAGKAEEIDPEKAKMLSMVVPGLGQAYIGDWGNALNSFLLNVSITGLGVFIGFQFGVIDVVISILPWLVRYYTGGFMVVEELAIQKKNQKTDLVFHDLLSLISDCNRLPVQKTK